ncbi:MAG: hypothetical protein JXM69_01555 [Anaerolineae bacterium]|nr:hypothetical protein [Anaerolineae bacterium]
MPDTRVMILEGSNGQSFFLKETLQAQNLSDQIDLVNRADDAIEMLSNIAYDLVVINLVEAWEQGMRLGLWLSQRPQICRTLLIISAELDRSLPSNGSFTILTEPVSLRGFADCVRSILQQARGGNISREQRSVNLSRPGLLTWSGGPLHQDYVGYWSPYLDSFLS